MMPTKCLHRRLRYALPAGFRILNGVGVMTREELQMWLFNQLRAGPKSVTDIERAYEIWKGVSGELSLAIVRDLIHEVILDGFVLQESNDAGAILSLRLSDSGKRRLGL